MNELGLGMTFSATDLATNVMQRVGRGMLDLEGRSSATSKRMQFSFDAMATGMSVFAGGAALLAGGGALANASGIFNEQVASVGAVANASAEELRALHDAALDAGVATQFSPNEAIVGLGDLAQAGYNAQESIGLLRPVLDLAAGSLGKLSPSGAAGLASQTMKAFKIPIGEAGITMDKLLQSVNAFALSAEELPLALGTAARGAGVMNQSLDETLIALGLVKNVVPGVERASTAVAVSMERMVNPEVANALKAQGVAVADARGKFRPFLDVIQDMIPALKKMGTEQKQAAFLTKTFGTEALGGIQAILQQVTNGIRDNTGETVTGAKAIAFLRDQFQDAGGTAQEFANKMLDTFEGQKKLFKGSMETLAIVLGEPFEQALKPVVANVLAILNQVLAFVKNLPAGVKNFVAQLVLVVGTVLTFLGAIIAAKAAIGMFLTGLGALGVSMGGVLAAFAPALVVFGAIAGAIYGIKYAYDKNLGGFGGQWGLVSTAIFKVKLAFEAIQQLISQGGLSGDALQGYLGGDSAVNFAIDIYVAYNKLQTFFDGFTTGLSSRMTTLGPVFERLATAVKGFFAALGIGTDIDISANADAMIEWGESGESAGKAAATAIEALTNALADATDAATGFVGKMDAMKTALEPVKGSLKQIGSDLKVVLVSLGLVDAETSKTASGWQTFGSIVGGVVAGVLGIFRGLISIVGGMFVGFSHIIIGWGQGVKAFFSGDVTGVVRAFLRVIYGAIRAAWSAVGGMVEAIAGLIDTVAAIGGKKLGAGDAVAGFRASVFKTIEQGFEIDKYDWQKPDGAKPEEPAPTGDMSQDPTAFFAMPPADGDMPIMPVIPNVAAAESQQAVDVEGLNMSIASLKSAKEGQTLIDATMTVDEEAFGRLVAKSQSGGAGGVTPVQVY